MKSLAKTLKSHQRFIYKQLYSTSSDKKMGKMNLELVDIPTEEEIEHEVSKAWLWVQSPSVWWWCE